MFGMFKKARNVRVVMPRRALEVVFAECDRYDADETGGRVVGTIHDGDSDVVINVAGIIEPGPSAQRTATYFKQDGDYQEDVFRKIENHHPEIEHLGNWHTHHVNGLRHLSGGDITTYRRIVEHEKHNIDFFYALLVTERNSRKKGMERYAFKNYLFQRGDPNSYEIPDAAVTLVDTPLVWPVAAQGPEADDTPQRQSRALDQEVLKDFFPGITPFMSKSLGVCWKGKLQLADGSAVEVVVVPDAADTGSKYAVSVRNPSKALEELAQAHGESRYSSCRAALIATERACNKALMTKR